MTAHRARALFAQHGPALIPGAIVVGLMIVWAIHDGGYDADTWYWGALLALATLAVVVVAGAARAEGLPRAALIAIGCFAAYVAWSYLSITWAASPGDALQGSNRALLYLIVFALMVALPWTPEAALAALVAFTLAVGAIAVVILLRFASADQVSQLLLDGRLAAPTGYFNASVALFSLDAFLAIALAARPELPGLLRGTLIGVACAGLQLAVVGQSRGWLFTLPLVAVVSIAVLSDRLRVVAAAILPIAAAVIPVHRLLGVYNAPAGSAIQAHAATRAGKAGLILSAAAMVLATLVAWAESLIRPRPLSRRRRLQVGARRHRARDRRRRSGGSGGDSRRPNPFPRQAVERLQPPALGSRIRVALRHGRERPLRLLEGRPPRRIDASDRRSRPGQLRRLLRAFTVARPRSRRGPTASSCACSRIRASSERRCSRRSWWRRSRPRCAPAGVPTASSREPSPASPCCRWSGG